MLGSAEPPPTFPWLLSCSSYCLAFAVVPPALAEQGAQSVSVENIVGKLRAQNQLRPWNASGEGRKALSC